METVVVEDFKAVIFRVGKEEYGLHIDQVVSIERMQPVTSVPKMPEHVIGVINLRGTVTPIVDLRKALLDKAAEENESTRIIVVQVDQKPIGLIVDAATDVLDIPTNTIQQPNLGQQHDASFLSGIAKLNERLLILLDINVLLSNVTKLNELKEITSQL